MNTTTHTRTQYGIDCAHKLLARSTDGRMDGEEWDGWDGVGSQCFYRPFPLLFVRVVLRYLLLGLVASGDRMGSAGRLTETWAASTFGMAAGSCVFLSFC